MENREIQDFLFIVLHEFFPLLPHFADDIVCFVPDLLEHLLVVDGEIAA